MCIGDNIDMVLWDKTTPKHKRFGRGVVINIKSSEICESGQMITVENPSGDTLVVDRNWVTSNEPDHDGTLFEL
jgi:hypothetical protein